MPQANILAAIHRRSDFVFALAFRRSVFLFQLRECAGVAKLIGDQPPEHVDKIEQVAGIFGQPMIRLDPVKRRRRAFVANLKAWCGRSGVVGSVNGVTVSW